MVWVDNSDFETSQVVGWDAFTWLMRILIYVPPNWQNILQESNVCITCKESFFSAWDLCVCMSLYFSDAASQLIPCVAPGKLMKLERGELHKKYREQNLVLSASEPKARTWVFQ